MAVVMLRLLQSSPLGANLEGGAFFAAHGVLSKPAACDACVCVCGLCAAIISC
jgi:hypothetical protein